MNNHYKTNVVIGFNNTVFIKYDYWSSVYKMLIATDNLKYGIITVEDCKKYYYQLDGPAFVTIC